MKFPQPKFGKPKEYYFLNNKVVSFKELVELFDKNTDEENLKFINDLENGNGGELAEMMRRELIKKYEKVKKLKL